jgi:predicted nucleotidyltransferase
LSDIEIKNMTRGLLESSYLPTHFELYLFGSRVDDTKKGGDIDLLMVLDEETYNYTIPHKHYLQAYLKKYLDEQRLDLTLTTQSKVASDSFFQSIKDDLILLLKK